MRTASPDWPIVAACGAANILPLGTYVVETQDGEGLLEEQDPRVYFAAERTLLAWVRTGLALMGFGFVVARFGLFLREMAVAEHVAPSRGQHASVWIGAALVAIGVAISVVAPVQHVRLVKSLRAGEVYEPKAISTAVVVSLALALVGLAIVLYLVTMR